MSGNKVKLIETIDYERMLKAIIEKLCGYLFCMNGDAHMEVKKRL